jgi:eukaryotic-like serine/threonine-protein kinase
VRLTPGTRVGPYEVVSLLGAGGMAEVYRAKDTRLGRDVAVKVVSEALGGDGAFLERFNREAKLAASLAHPNVVALHDVGFHDGKPYFVTELLQGESLRERLAKGPIALGKALEWAAQMAQGLAAAHERGIVHRDLKPENVFITRDGHVKLLDFGIAKLVETAQGATPHGLMEPTVSPSGGSTGTGMVLGTPGYMSPEQVRGDAVDARTDFFSLGAVLYEMLSGHRAFPTGPVVESGYAILHNELEPLPETVPPLLSQVVHRCLEKDAARRFQSARDLAFNLELLRAPTGTTTPAPSTGSTLALTARWRRLAIPLALVAIGVAGGALFTRRATSPAGQPEVEQITFSLGNISNARFAPDGRVIYSASLDGAPSELFARSPGAYESQPLGLRDMRLLAVSGTGELAVALHPTGNVAQGGRGTLALVSGPGATPREVAESIVSADFSPSGLLAGVRATGDKYQLEYPLGTPLFETTGYILNPRVSPSGDSVAFIHDPTVGPDEVVIVDQQGRKSILSTWKEGIGGLVWAPDGQQLLVTTSLDAIWAQRRSGGRHLVYQNVGDVRVWDVSRAGTVLVYQGDPRQEVAVLVPGQQHERRLSPFDNADLRALSGDGKSVLFSSQAQYFPNAGTSELAFLRSTDASPPVHLGSGHPLAFSPDKKWALIQPDGDPGYLSLMPLGPGQPQKVPLAGLEVVSARWLQNGERIAISGRQPGDKEVYLYVLPLAGGVPKRISNPLSTPHFEVSLDDRLAAARALNGSVTLFALDGSPPVALPELGREVVPAGWSADGKLWVQKFQDVPMRLLLFDTRRRRVVEERTVGPSDLAGVTLIPQVRITPDGQTLAFDYLRRNGYLFLIDGLLSRQ